METTFFQYKAKPEVIVAMIYGAWNDIGGLQRLNQAGEWFSAPPLDGAFIVNIGDLIRTFTNDGDLSTVHYVINTSGQQCYSLPFFIALDFDAVVDVVPTCRSPESPAKYSAYTSDVPDNHKR